MDKHESTLADALGPELAALAARFESFEAAHPGASTARQPIHVVYGGAHLFRHDAAAKLGRLALRTLDAYGPSPFTFARAVELPGASHLPVDQSRATSRYITDPEALRREDPRAWLALTVYDRVRAKLEREPVEDFRIDFEDGFGYRPDDEEDATAVGTAQELAIGMRKGTLPPFIGVRIKALGGRHTHRALRTLDLFVSTCVAEVGRLPDNFVVTLPKVAMPEQVATLVRAFELLERRHQLEPGALRLEFMIELAHALFDDHGQLLLPRLLDAAAGRCTSAHFGTYDFTATYGVTASCQRMDHPACDFALDLMKASFAETGVHVVDGATNVLPVPRHRGHELTAEQQRENLDTVHAAWRLSHRHIRQSLTRGYYQGWDVHPAQLPVRYAASYAFFLEGLEPTATRLGNFLDQATKASLVGEVFDDAASGQGLLNYFLRALACGAVTLAELERAGLSEAELRTRSFARILEGRLAQHA